MTDIVASLADAVVGSAVWHYDRQAHRRDENRKYLGRGVWTVEVIESKTRKSLIVGRNKFDRKTGVQIGTKGYTPQLRIAGKAERQAIQWLSARYAIAKIVGDLSDIDTIKQVAALVGFPSPMDQPEGIEP